MGKDQSKQEQTVFTEEVNEVVDEQIEQETSSTGLKPNLAAALSYFFGILTGLIFFMMEKENEYVRFHAMQSILLTGAIFIISIVLSFIPIFGWLISLLMSPVLFILWLFLMYKAYRGNYFKLPVIGDMAEQQVKK